MKIINRQEFLKLPAGTLFSFYEPCIFNGLNVKGDSIKGFNGELIDFSYNDLIGNVESTDSTDFINIVDDSAKNHTEFALDFDCYGRDGLYDKDALYAVYSVYEIHELQKTISKCTGYDNGEV